MLKELTNKLDQRKTRVSQDTWTHLLGLKEKLKAGSNWKTLQYDESSGFSFDEHEVAGDCKISKEKISSDSWEVKSFFKDQFFIGYNENISAASKELLSRYLPVILLGTIKKDRPTIIVHMAQSLDGKVCTENGNSKWIGNQENLIHAHRLRALVDSVLVGGNTLANDLPRLNVRHVPGNNPKRVFLSSSFEDFHRLPEVEDAEVILLRNLEKACELKNGLNITQLCYEGNTEEKQIVHILELLKNKGINSLMIEGGPNTVSSFFKCGVVDWLQVHIAPKLFGSGKSMISLPEICEVSDSYTLDNVQYDVVGDGFMVTGEINTHS